MADIARRSLLARLSAAPAVVAAATLPLPAMAHPAGRVHADADLIARAALVTRLARLHDRAHVRLSRKGDAVMLARGPKPTDSGDTSGLCEIAEHTVDPASDIERRFTITYRKPTAARQEARRRHDEALSAWQTESDRLMRSAGIAEAGALCDALFDRLQVATNALAATPATSPAGLAAKAGAFLALMQTRDGAEQWEADLGRSLARDAAQIGTGAA